MKNFLKNNLKTILAIGATAIICISGTVFAAYQYSASQVSYKDGKNLESALNELYEYSKSSTSTMGTVAFYSSVFDGTTTSYRNIELLNRNENCTELDNEILYINKKGKYKAYLSVANGTTDGNFGSKVDFFIDDDKVAYSYFDRVSNNCSGTVCYEFDVKENERKKISSKVISDRDWAAGYAAVTGSVIIVKTE